MKLVKDDSEQELVDAKLYRSLVGSPLYIGKQTSLDILNVVVEILRKAQHYALENSKTCFKISQRNSSFTVNFRSSMKLVGDADADWSGDSDDRNSAASYYFKFQGNGATMSWEVEIYQQNLYLELK